MSKNKNELDISQFNHKIKEQVKFHEVDLLGVCNNAVYFNYFEDGRLKYVQDLRAKYNLKEFLEGESFFIMVHNNCDYYDSAHLDEELFVFTRINFIKNSSFGFEHLVQNIESEKIIASGGGVVVHINKTTKDPVPLLQEFYEAVRSFEKEVDILKNKD